MADKTFRKGLDWITALYNEAVAAAWSLLHPEKPHNPEISFTLEVPEFDDPYNDNPIQYAKKFYDSYKGWVDNNYTNAVNALAAMQNPYPNNPLLNFKNFYESYKQYEGWLTSAIQSNWFGSQPVFDGGILRNIIYFKPFNSPFDGNPLKDLFEQGALAINTAITGFTEALNTNPINDFVSRIEAGKSDIESALQGAGNLKLGLEAIPGIISEKTREFLTNLPNLTDMEDQIMNTIINQIVEAVKAADFTLNENNMMIYAGEFKSSFTVTIIPAMSIDTSFGIKVGPTTK